MKENYLKNLGLPGKYSLCALLVFNRDIHKYCCYIEHTYCNRRIEHTYCNRRIEHVL